MNINMNGKPINCFDVNPVLTPHGNPDRICSGRGLVLTLSATHHGDHDQFWIVETAMGAERRRWNCSIVAHIEWAADPLPA